MSLKGKSAVVTGGGRGIGSACAEALARSGARVLVCSRTRGEVGTVAASLRRKGFEAFAAVCDVTDAASVEKLSREARRRLGAVDILVNNAGIAPSAPFGRLTLEEWNRVLAVNATGAFLCMRAFLPGMLERGWGRVMNVASTAALKGGDYIAAYAASKHALLGLTRSVAAGMRGTGVAVGAVCPAFVDTDITRRSVANIRAKTGMSRKNALAALLATERQKRLIRPEEVARAVVSLCVGARSNGRVVVLRG